MTRINLLPWRDELRKQRQEEFIIGIVAVAIAAVAIMFGVEKYLDSLIVEQPLAIASIKWTISGRLFCNN
jgi:type IV pilus assembly protein PilN